MPLPTAPPPEGRKCVVREIRTGEDGTRDSRGLSKRVAPGLQRRLQDVNEQAER